jgi:hypothetical protein
MVFNAIFQQFTIKVLQRSAGSPYLLWHYTILTLPGHGVHLQEKQLVCAALQYKVHAHYAAAIEVLIYIASFTF